MGRRHLPASAALVLVLACVQLASAQTRHLTTVEGLRRFSSFYHLQNVVVRGEIEDDGRTLRLRGGNADVRLIPAESVSTASGPVEVRGQLFDVGRLEPTDPRVTAVAEGREDERWPRPGEELFVRATAITEAPPPLEPTVRALALEPWRYEGQRVTVTGNFRARNLLGDLPGAPGRDRYEFVIRGAEGAIWVTGMQPRGRGFQFETDRRIDTDKWLEVTGTVVHERGLVRIEASRLALADAPQLEEIPEVVEVPGPPPPPVEMVFSAPTRDEIDVNPAAPVRIQFSRGLDPATIAGSIRVGYVSAPAGTTLPRFEVSYDGANRAVTLTFAEPLERFVTVRVEILDTLKAFDGAPAVPATLVFTVGG